MDTDSLFRFLLLCLAFNYALLFAWFFAFVGARASLRRLHGRWFALSDEAFDAIHYGGMAFCKLLVLVFNLAPLLALWVLRSGR